MKKKSLISYFFCLWCAGQLIPGCQGVPFRLVASKKKDGNTRLSKWPTY